MAATDSNTKPSLTSTDQPCHSAPPRCPKSRETLEQYRKSDLQKKKMPRTWTVQHMGEKGSTHQHDPSEFPT